MRCALLPFDTLASPVSVPMDAAPEGKRRGARP
jgi:hypothetical protein